jgi:lipid-A-disaccharide synthase
MKVLAVAGESSGDRHAAAVITQLAGLHGPLEVRGMGGVALERSGARLDIDLRETTAMGSVELAGRMPKIIWAMLRLIGISRRWRPDVALLVDLPDFNLPLGRWLKSLGVPVLGYVAPQFWAWRPGRLSRLAESIDHLACVLPFELGPLRSAGVPATFVGHPLLDERRPDREEVRRAIGIDDGVTCLALLPGSRPAEIDRLLQPMLRAAAQIRSHSRVEIVVGIAPSLSRVATMPDWVRPLCHPTWEQPGSAALAAADVGLVASGTATLEAALSGLPQVAVYRLARASYALARLVVRSRFMALPNVILGHRVIPELLQGRASAEVMADHLRTFLHRPSLADQQRLACVPLRALLSGPGASFTTARLLARLAMKR